jgi:hypothetical protein
LPHGVRLSFVLENVFDAVVAQHGLASAPPAAALLAWCWNEAEMPKLVTLGCWWVASLLTQIPGRAAALAPHGDELQPSELAAMSRCEAASLRGVARLFCSLVAKQVATCTLGRLGGAVGDRATAAVWSQLLPHALALATRDAASLAWPHVACALAPPPPPRHHDAAAKAEPGYNPLAAASHDAAGLWLVGVWSFLLTGEQAAHVVARNVAASAVPQWPRPRLPRPQPCRGEGGRLHAAKGESGKHERRARVLNSR